jgi:DNA-binding response OmpR family regulator
MSEKKRVLLVDDSPMVLDIARDALEDAGFQVLTANDLNELENLRQTGEPDLILMDVQMPEAFGDDVAMVLKMVRGVNTPIYLLSNLDEEELAERAEDAECDGYIWKRAGIDALVDRVKEILSVDG